MALSVPPPPNGPIGEGVPFNEGAPTQQNLGPLVNALSMALMSLHGMSGGGGGATGASDGFDLSPGALNMMPSLMDQDNILEGNSIQSAINMAAQEFGTGGPSTPQVANLLSSTDISNPNFLMNANSTLNQDMMSANALQASVAGGFSAAMSSTMSLGQAQDPFVEAAYSALNNLMSNPDEVNNIDAGTASASELSALFPTLGANGLSGAHGMMGMGGMSAGSGAASFTPVSGVPKHFADPARDSGTGSNSGG